ncbi:1,4-dihydroxy-2-naphthoate octaprenyltransferase [Mesonia sp. K7]|uniref:1,4-dihydroxy-2-naphthoate octaprenyltransferase n=1 Tax=Mesonia sp. K7 TaxID=2218606 RepID=UPI000DA82825|nr:1,4-dihydroxy-2-naphthoate octaprenyltransferase [Mesonia sp. K7]PZD77243.1 1,4-dihydroxy-2-naphthoate octaprenyltransferase [Mesonia sp. K7]
MSKFKNWVSAARLRTLPLSVSGIIMGTALADLAGFFDIGIFILALLTTLSLQVLSNFANDYGDGIKGTDNEHRVGPKRALQSGAISNKQMKKGIVINSIICLCLAALLIYFSFTKEQLVFVFFFLVLGVLAVVAAIKYTVGKSAYGYAGLGDVFVFIFFGLVSVLGVKFLYHQDFSWFAVLPATTIGLLSTAVLNLNNIRDIENDRFSNKNTLVVKIGAEKALKYHFGIIITAFISFLIYLFLLKHPILFSSLIAFVPVFFHIKKVVNFTNPKQFDAELKVIALSTFLLSLLFMILVFIK